MRRLVAVLIGLALATACGSSPTSPTGQNTQNVHSCAGGTLSGSMSATIDGTSFVATCLDAMSIVQGIVGFGSTNVTQNNLSSFIDVAIAVQTSAPGTFTLGNKSVNNAAVSVGGSKIWQSGAASTGTGTVVISAFTANEVSGTFTFDMVAGPGATGTKTVRNGQFDLKF